MSKTRKIRRARKAAEQAIAEAEFAERDAQFQRRALKAIREHQEALLRLVCEVHPEGTLARHLLGAGHAVRVDSDFDRDSHIALRLPLYERGWMIPRLMQALSVELKTKGMRDQLFVQVEFAGRRVYYATDEAMTHIPHEHLVQLIAEQIADRLKAEVRNAA